VSFCPLHSTVLVTSTESLQTLYCSVDVEHSLDLDEIHAKCLIHVHGFQFVFLDWINGIKMKIILLFLLTTTVLLVTEARHRSQRHGYGGGNRGHGRHDQRPFGRTGEDWDDDLEVDWPNADDFEWDDIEIDRRSNNWRGQLGAQRGRGRLGFFYSDDDLDWLPTGRRWRSRGRGRGRGRGGRRDDMALVEVDDSDEMPTLDTDPDLGRHHDPKQTSNRRPG
jgi:hypothetical protein